MKKWARRGLILLVVLSFVWWTGIPQELGIEWGAKAFGGVVIEVNGGRYLGGLRFDSLVIYPNDVAKRNDQPFALLTDVIIEFDKASGSNRKIESVRIHDFDVLAEKGDAPNYQFLIDLATADTQSTDDTWIPKSVYIEDFSAQGNADDLRAKIAGLSAEIYLLSSEDIEITLKGDQCGFSYEEMDADEVHVAMASSAGALEATLSYRDSQVEFSLRFDDPTYFQLATRGEILFGGESLEARHVVLEMVVHNDLWQALIAGYGVEPKSRIHQTQIVFSNGSWREADGPYPTADVLASIVGLVVGDEDTPLYSGLVLVPRLHLAGGEALIVEGEIGLGHDLMSTVSAGFSENGQNVTVHFSDWEKSALVVATPDDFQGGLEELAFDRLSGDVYLELKESAYTLTSDVRSTSASGDSPVGLQVSLEGETGKVAGTTGSLALTLGEGKMTGDGRMTEDGDYEADLKLESMPLRSFALLAMGTRLPEEVSGTLDGMVTVRQAAGSVEAVVTPSVMLTNVVYEGEEQSDFTLGGLFQVDTETRIARSDSLTLRTDYDEVLLSLSEVEYDLNTGDLSSEVEYAFDLVWVDALGDLGGAYGMLKGTGTLSGSEGAYVMPFVAESNDFGYGDLLSLWDIPFIAKGTLQYQEENDRFDLIETRMTVGEGTSVDIAQVSYVDGVLRGEAVAKSDLDLLVKMAYAESVDADVKSVATWVIDEENTNVEWSTSGTVAQMTLMEKAGMIENVSYELAGDYGEVLSGEGRLSVAALSSVGATVHGFNGSLGFEENALVISNVRSEVFGGTLESRVTIAVLEEGIPIRYEGEFASMDLARMTEEVQPPKTTMTGIAFGDIEADYSITDGLLAFELDVQSNEGFTINRSLVEEMMQMQTVLKGLGVKRAEKTMAKFLGENPQRPFDTARMTVFLWEGVIEGVSELKSAKTRDYNGLNLTIQLSIDQPALVQSLKMLEDSGTMELGI